jgi:hypothetical protein
MESSFAKWNLLQAATPSFRKQAGDVKMLKRSGDQQQISVKTAIHRQANYRAAV